MLIEICALAEGAKAIPASNAAVESNVVSPRIYDPLEVSTIPEMAWDAGCSRKGEPGNSSNHKDLETVPKGPHQRWERSSIYPYVPDGSLRDRPGLSNRDHADFKLPVDKIGTLAWVRLALARGKTAPFLNRDRTPLGHNCFATSVCDDNSIYVS